MLDERTGLLLANTFYLIAGTLAISLPTGTLLAVLLMRTDLPLRRFWLGLLAAMLFVPFYLHAAAWQAGFGLQGWYTMVLADSQAAPWLAGWRGAVWVHGMASIPWVALIVGIGLRLVEPELEEDALLHVPPWKAFLHVTLRRAAPLVVVAALWVAVTTAGEMTVTDLFQVRTYAEELYTNFALGDPEATRMGMLPIALVTTLGVFAAGAMLARLTRERAFVPGRRMVVFRSGQWRLPLAMLVCGILLVAVAVPVANLMYMAGTEVTRSGDDLVRTWTVVKLLRMVASSPSKYWQVFLWSHVISASAATAAVLISLPVAWVGRRRVFAGSIAFVLVAACLALPPPVLALNVTAALTMPESGVLEFLRNRTIFAPWLGQTVRALPLSFLILWSALRSVPEETLEIARLDGGGRLAQLFQIALPLRWPAVIAAWLVAFAVALGDLAATIMLVPPGVATLSTKIFELIHYGVDDNLAGLCLAMFMLVAAIAWGVAVLSKHLQRG